MLDLINNCDDKFQIGRTYIYLNISFFVDNCNIIYIVYKKNNCYVIYNYN